MRSRSRSKKGKGMKNESESIQYILDNIQFFSFSKQGYGAKKAENQDSVSVMDQKDGLIGTEKNKNKEK